MDNELGVLSNKILGCRWNLGNNRQLAGKSLYFVYLKLGISSILVSIIVIYYICAHVHRTHGVRLKEVFQLFKPLGNAQGTKNMGDTE